MKTLRDYQAIAVRRGLLQNILEADECGLGKTLIGIEVAMRLQEMVEDDETDARLPNLIIAPKMIRYQWVQEIADQYPQARVLMLGNAGRKPADADPFCLYNFVITHYEGLWGPTKHELASTLWRTIIADEAHMIKNRRAKRTVFLKHLRAERKIAITATPWEHPEDLWSILNWLSPLHYGSYWRWVKKHCSVYQVQTKTHQFTEIGKVLDPEALAEELSRWAIRRLKTEVAPELPAKIFTTIELELLPEQQRQYAKLAASKDIIVNLEDKELLIQNALALLVRLQQIASNPALLGLKAPSAKLEWLDEWLEANPSTSAVIFTRFRDTAIHIAGKYKTALLIGGTQRDLDEFLAGRQRLLAGTLKAMGPGLNLQRASTAIFVDQDWSQTLMTQAVDRIHRIGIKEPKQIYTLLTNGTVDKLINRSLTKKWTQTDLVMHFLKGDYNGADN